jgi:hypothetical protein
MSALAPNVAVEIPFWVVHLYVICASAFRLVWYLSGVYFMRNPTIILTCAGRAKAV